MTLDETLAKLTAHEPALRARGATALFLFGSVARDDPRARDVDLFVDYDAGTSFSLIELVGIKQLLEAELGTEVDVTTHDSLHPLLKDSIEQSAIRVF